MLAEACVTLDPWIGKLIRGHNVNRPGFGGGSAALPLGMSSWRLLDAVLRCCTKPPA